MPDAKERICLKCNQPFMSFQSKAKNRICPICAKGKQSSKDITRPAGPHRKGGESRAT